MAIHLLSSLFPLLEGLVPWLLQCGDRLSGNSTSIRPQLRPKPRGKTLAGLSLYGARAYLHIPPAASHLVGKVFPAGPTGVHVPCHFTARSCNCQHGSTLIFTPMPPECLGLPPRAHLRPGSSWSHHWRTRVTASPGPSTTAKPPAVVAGMRHVGREVCSWPLAPLVDVDTPTHLLLLTPTATAPAHP